MHPAVPRRCRVPLFVSLLAVAACTAGGGDTAAGGGSGTGTGGGGGAGGGAVERMKGETCTTARPCAAGLQCVRSDDGAYRCMESCPTEDRLCEDGALCTASGSGAVCYTGGSRDAGATCTSGLDCAPGLGCYGNMMNGFRCVRACNTADTNRCRGDETCRIVGTGTSGYCTVAPGVGAACTMASECNGLSCESEASSAGIFPRGMCTKRCTSDSECSDGTCRSLNDAGVGLCFRACASDDGCRAAENWQCMTPEVCATRPMSAECGAFVADAGVCLKRGSF